MITDWIPCRGLVVSWDSFIQYPFDSVLPLLTLEELKLGGVKTMDIQTVILERPEDARTIACSNWNETLTGEGRCTVPARLDSNHQSYT